MKSIGRRIGPGVYAVGPLGEIEMDRVAIDRRRAVGLPAPAEALHLTRAAKRGTPHSSKLQATGIFLTVGGGNAGELHPGGM